MDNENKLELDLKISDSENTRFSLRQLEELRLNLAETIRSEFSQGQIDLYQEPASRSLDPAVVGAIALAISPIIVEKIADILITWTERNKDATITLSIPIEGTAPVQITYQPGKTSPETLKGWVKSAIDAAKSER